MHPNGVIGEPEDVAELICFLSSDAARMITASSFTIDGGKTGILQIWAHNKLDELTQNQLIGEFNAKWRLLHRNV